MSVYFHFQGDCGEKVWPRAYAAGPEENPDHLACSEEKSGGLKKYCKTTYGIAKPMRIFTMQNREESASWPIGNGKAKAGMEGL